MGGTGRANSPLHIKAPTTVSLRPTSPAKRSHPPSVPTQSKALSDAVRAPPATSVIPLTPGPKPSRPRRLGRKRRAPQGPDQKTSSFPKTTPLPPNNKPRKQQTPGRQAAQGSSEENNHVPPHLQHHRTVETSAIIVLRLNIGRTWSNRLQLMAGRTSKHPASTGAERPAYYFTILAAGT